MRPPEWPQALTAFADDLEAVLGEGRHELTELVAALNERGSLAPDGSPWTEDVLRARLAELGK
jgi:hypothetical protein